MKYTRLLLSLSIWVGIHSCVRDQVIPPEFICDTSNTIELSYTNGMAEIITNSCANIGCHDGSDNSGVVRDYRTYLGLLPELENGEIKAEVFALFSMPVTGSEGAANFTDEDRLKLECWIDNGFPE